MECHTLRSSVTALVDQSREIPPHLVRSSRDPRNFPFVVTSREILVRISREIMCLLVMLRLWYFSRESHTLLTKRCISCGITCQLSFYSGITMQLQYNDIDKSHLSSVPVTAAMQAFQRFIDNVCLGLDFVCVYLDDLLVPRTSEIEHSQHLRLLFRRLEDNVMW